MVSQFSQLQGAQQGAAPFMPQPMQSGLGVNPNAGAQAMQFAAQNYGTQVRGMANQSNPWMTGLGFVGGALGGPMLGAMGAAAGAAASGGLFGGTASPVVGPSGMHLPYQAGGGLAYTIGGY